MGRVFKTRPIIFVVFSDVTNSIRTNTAAEPQQLQRRSSDSLSALDESAAIHRSKSGGIRHWSDCNWHWSLLERPMPRLPVLLALWTIWVVDGSVGTRSWTRCL